MQFCPEDGARLESRDELVPGMVVREKYEILEEIGSGGMGRVFRVKDVDFAYGRNQSAMKIPFAELAADAGFVRRFRDEAAKARVLNHDNVVRIEHIDRTDSGMPFLVMELVAGRSLRWWMEQTPHRNWRDAAGIACEIGQALRAAHDAGIVHCDIKPENILSVSHDAPLPLKVTDFGLAKATDVLLGNVSRVHETTWGPKAVVGTPGYMSPEQEWGRANVGPPSDVYSLGVVLFELMTGNLPASDAEARKQAMRAHAGAPAELVNLTEEMLDSFPERRPKIAEVVNRLTKCGTALPPRSEDRGKTVFEDVPPTAGHNQEKTSGGDAMAHYQAGVGFRAAGQLDQAKEEFLKALLINPNFPAAQNLLGLVFLKKGEHDMAVAAFRTCIRLKADSAEAHHNLGVALHEKKDDSAMDSFKEALRLNPDLAETRKSLAALHNNRGDVLLGQKKNRLAKQEYLEALKMNPDSAAVRKNLQTANFISFEMYWQPSLLIAFCATEIIGDLHIVPLKLSFVEYGILSLMSIAGLIGLAYMPAGKTLRHKLLRLGRALLFGSLFAWAVIILARSA